MTHRTNSISSRNASLEANSADHLHLFIEAKKLAFEDRAQYYADPEFAAKVGFDKPILHGLCTFGYAGRAVVANACSGDPERLSVLRGQFSKPVFPGDTLVVRGWNEGERVVLTVSTEERPDELCLANAHAVIR